MSLKRNVLDLRKRKEIVLQGGGEEAIKKQAAMGKLTARERIEAILDKNSFHEYDMFVEHQSKDFDMDKKVLQNIFLFGFSCFFSLCPVLRKI